MAALAGFLGKALGWYLVCWQIAYYPGQSGPESGHVYPLFQTGMEWHWRRTSHLCLGHLHHAVGRFPDYLWHLPLGEAFQSRIGAFQNPPQKPVHIVN